MKLWRYGHVIERLSQHYRLEGVLGSGGMADVCLAYDEREEREVAIKIIKPDQLDQRTLDRFLKEAAQVTRWQHPNILHIYSDLRLELLDAAQGSIVPYIVMEYARGGDLHRRLSRRVPYPLGATLHIFAQLCSAVAYAHERGIVHRDLKPLNVLFRVLPDGSEQVVLSDFGLAVEANATHWTFARGGTLPYMAPEQLRGQVQPASDIFALGVILYQLCTGHLPFRRTLRDLDSDKPVFLPPPLGELVATLPKALDNVVLKAMESDPTRRFATATELWEAVREAAGTTAHGPSTMPYQAPADPRRSWPVLNPLPDPISSAGADSEDDEEYAEMPSSEGLDGASSSSGSCSGDYKNRGRVVVRAVRILPGRIVPKDTARITMVINKY